MSTIDRATIGRLLSQARRQASALLALVAVRFAGGRSRRMPAPGAGDGLPPGLKREMPLIPVDSAASRALVAVIAILAFLAALAGGAAHMVARASADWRGAVSNEMTIQVRPDPRRNVEEDVRRVAEIARAAAGVRSARIVPREESDRMLEPWLGAGLALSELPVPRLVVLGVAPGSRPDIAAMREALRRAVPVASLDDHRLWIGRLSTMANTVILAGVAIVVLIAIAAALAVAFATRGAMAGSHDSVEVLHLVGADDAFIASEFQGRFLKLGLEGGAIGGAAALVVTLLIGLAAAGLSSGPGSDQLAALFGGFEIGWLGYVIVMLVALAVALIAGLVSRVTVRRHLARMA